MTLLGQSTVRVATAVVLGLLLGAVGLPRVDLTGLPGVAGPVADGVQLPPEQTGQTDQPGPAATPAAVDPTSTAVPAATDGPRVLIDERFGEALPQWLDDPQGPAWFPGGGFHLFARQQNRFVAVGVPLQSAVGDAVIRAQFRKLGGPAGGGYGLIIRDQSPPSERDGQRQDGQYLVLEVGDRGDVGVWQRDQTHWIDIVPWTHSDAVRTGLDGNALVITTQNLSLRFEVNGQVVADVTYEGLPPAGGVGIFVGGDLNQVALDWLRIEG